MTESARYVELTAETADLLSGTDVFDNPVDSAQLSAFLKDPGHGMFLALIGTVVIGFASGTVLLHPDKTPALLVNEVEVAEAYRRQGHARHLLAALQAWGGARGCASCWLATETDNVAARGLYRSAHGAEQPGVVAFHWQLTMEKGTAPGTGVKNSSDIG